MSHILRDLVRFANCSGAALFEMESILPGKQSNATRFNGSCVILKSYKNSKDIAHYLNTDWPYQMLSSTEPRVGRIMPPKNGESAVAPLRQSIFKAHLICFPYFSFIFFSSLLHVFYPLTI